jgi:hypothetical protein
MGLGARVEVIEPTGLREKLFAELTMALQRAKDGKPQLSR